MGSRSDPYCRHLKTLPGERAVEYGLPGETSDAMVRRVEEVLHSIGEDARIRVFIAMGGTNDLFRGPSAESVVSNMHGVVRKALEKADTVLLMTLPVFPNLVKYLPEGAEKVKRINEAIRATRMERVRVVDLSKHVSPDDASLWDADGLHPNMQGYARFAEVIQSEHPDLFGAAD